jgi:alkylhydroperoxidase family enzyme
VRFRRWRVSSSMTKSLPAPCILVNRISMPHYPPGHTPPAPRKDTMRIPDWTPALKPQPQDLVDAVLKRRGGTLINLDKALLWSEPLARGWNVYLGAVRTGLPTSRKLRELGICTVALLTGAAYEYKHHAPDFLAAGGSQAELDALNTVVKADARTSAAHPALGAVEQLVIRYAAQMTLDVKVSDDVFESLRQHFDTTELVELTSAIATYNMVARFLVALGVSPEEHD